MDELAKITEKYDADYLAKGLASLEAINVFALSFYKDVAEIFDVLSRLKNVERNPTGFGLTDAPILGLLVKVWKVLKEVVRYYEEDNTQMIGILERPMMEAAVLAAYLMSQPDEVIEDYRKLSYKDRLRLLRELKAGSPFFDTKAGKRLLAAVQEKMRFENLTENDFAAQKANKWRLQGKSFRDIFAEIEHDSLYPATYGMMSESIHGSWNESMDWDLRRNDDGTFSAYALHCPADIRFVTPTLRFAIEPYRLWLKRIDCLDENTAGVLDWIERVNTALFHQFDRRFGEDFAPKPS
jgi:Family of unknown function (DUF5677)